MIKHQKIHNVCTFLIEIEVTRIDKNGEKIAKNYPYYYLLIAQGLW